MFRGFLGFDPQPHGSVPFCQRIPWVFVFVVIFKGIHRFATLLAPGLKPAEGAKSRRRGLKEDTPT